MSGGIEIMPDCIKVSICCLTYNQKNFIADAINSFLNQKCDFLFEIIIHDDCSTDGTIGILKDFEHRYPNIIKLILEEENQFSLGMKIFPLTFEKARGEYIALCEGDDYWIDNQKLQKQVDYMDSHQDCSLTFHNAYRFDQQSKSKTVFLPTNQFSANFYKKSHMYNVGELELLGFVPTASFVTRSSYLKKLPEIYYSSPVGDLPIKLHCASQGYTYYFDEIMSIYRVNSGSSIMDGWSDYKIKQRVTLEYKLLAVIHEFNRITNLKYFDLFEKDILFREINIYFLENDYKKLRNKKYKDIIKLMGKKIGLQINLLIYFPSLAVFLKKTKRVLSHKKRTE